MIFVPSAAIAGSDDPVPIWARRPLWYDWKEGAAVMWTPHYYQEWSKRRSEVIGLQTVDAVLAYACAKGIDYLVETPDRVRNDDVSRLVQHGIVFTNDKYVILRTSALCRAKQ
ncbi:MAG: hypothetical protein WDN49_20000 [Acetobacteraceae bacterium]